jgi:MoaA/NifB/PqqE/SkfB family radical SAM enzyme
MKKPLIKYWQEAIQNKIAKNDLQKANLNHYPPLCSVVFTRQCVLNCQHCAYPKANCQDLKSNNLRQIDKVIQATYDVGVRDLIHVGRILKKEHLPILKKYQRLGMNINLIDNGHAQFLIPEIKKAALRFDGGIDISIDGDKKSHEIQRGKDSYEMAIEGAKKLRKVADHISITGTASSINYNSIAKGLKDLRKKIPFAKIFQITTTAPCKHHKKRMSLNEKEMQKLFYDMLKISKNTAQTLQISRFEDLQSIFPLLIKYKKPEFKNISIEWKINNLIVEYLPGSTLTAEEFPIDANGIHFLPMGGNWHLNERPSLWQNNNDLIIQDPDESYRRIVKKYWKNRGKRVFDKEKKLFEGLFNV